MEIRAGTTTPTTALDTAASKLAAVGASPVPFTYLINKSSMASWEALCTLTILVSDVTASSLVTIGLAATVIILLLALPIISAVVLSLAVRFVASPIPIWEATEAKAVLTKPLGLDSASELAKELIGGVDNRLVAIALVSKTV